jgi:hypothetical protein
MGKGPYFLASSACPLFEPWANFASSSPTGDKSPWGNVAGLGEINPGISLALFFFEEKSVGRRRPQFALALVHQGFIERRIDARFKRRKYLRRGP